MISAERAYRLPVELACPRRRYFTTRARRQEAIDYARRTSPLNEPAMAFLPFSLRWYAIYAVFLRATMMACRSNDLKLLYIEMLRFFQEYLQLRCRYSRLIDYYGRNFDAIFDKPSSPLRSLAISITPARAEVLLALLRESSTRADVNTATLPDYARDARAIQRESPPSMPTISATRELRAMPGRRLSRYCHFARKRLYCHFRDDRCRLASPKAIAERKMAGHISMQERRRRGVSFAQSISFYSLLFAFTSPTRSCVITWQKARDDVDGSSSYIGLSHYLAPPLAFILSLHISAAYFSMPRQGRAALRQRMA